jgi:hypothetical protein
MVNTINERAPMKKGKSMSQPAPFMNKTLRSAVYKKKRMTHNTFLKDKSKKNREAYRKQRHLVTKLKSNQLEHISMKDVLADQNLLTFIQQLNHF